MAVQCFWWSVSSDCSCDAFAFAVDKMCYLACEQKSRTEVDVSNNWKAAIVHVPYPAIKDEIHAWLVRE
ncbi:hypothetical protein BDL97_19G064100 [Sphagnum fallax]|nr:hypothetical protein BDL97_19G064100 [Sphagnum fallax]KAH8932300.1 hypothetical protein BDL97_19G064100 [Sphagnum fallax]KAH8932301.1 hypothetical protein BDL97_19G064100 [Sphagnum fallax]